MIGVVLTGMLDDGAAGLWTVKDRGGVAVVQDPAEARERSMPENALRQVAVDHNLRLADMPAVLARLAAEEVSAMTEPVPEDMRVERGSRWRTRPSGSGWQTSGSRRCSPARSATGCSCG